MPYALELFIERRVILVESEVIDKIKNEYSRPEYIIAIYSAPRTNTNNFREKHENSELWQYDYPQIVIIIKQIWDRI